MHCFRSQFDKLQRNGDRDHHQGEIVQRQSEHVFTQGKEVVIGITVKYALSKVSPKRSCTRAKKSSPWVCEYSTTHGDQVVGQGGEVVSWAEELQYEEEELQHRG
jgi:hypothetical protein